jgi:hypothetical protein
VKHTNLASSAGIKDEPNVAELLRLLLVAWYRKGHPWQTQPTLATFRVSLDGKTQKAVGALLDTLISRQGPAMELQHLRLQHLLDLQ